MIAYKEQQLYIIRTKKSEIVSRDCRFVAGITTLKKKSVKNFEIKQKIACFQKQSYIIIRYYKNFLQNKNTYHKKYYTSLKLSKSSTPRQKQIVIRSSIFSDSYFKSNNFRFLVISLYKEDFSLACEIFKRNSPSLRLIQQVLCKYSIEFLKGHKNQKFPIDNAQMQISKFIIIISIQSISFIFQKKAMGRKKILIRKIKSDKIRKITFRKRKVGLLKKASELAILCGASVKIRINDEFGVTQEFKNTQDLDLKTQNPVVAKLCDYPRFEKLRKKPEPEMISQSPNKISNNQQIEKIQQMPVNPFLNYEAALQHSWYQYWLFQNGLATFQ